MNDSKTPYGTIVYETPVGTFATWDEAADRCDRADLDPVECIKMKTVANG